VLWHQTANATSADVPYCAWLIYKDATGVVSGLPQPTSPVDVSGVDVLHWNAWMLSSTASGTVTPLQRENIDLSTKRKLTTGDGIYMVANIPADAVTPAANMVGLFRMLVDRA